MGTNIITRVCISVQECYCGKSSQQFVVLARVIDAVERDVSFVCVKSGAHALVEALINYLGSS